MSASDFVIIRCSKHESGINELEMHDIQLQAAVTGTVIKELTAY